MDYNILYIEDQGGESIQSDLQSLGYTVKLNDTEDFLLLFKEIKEEFDAYILDFRLTSKKGILDAPAIAQAMRTKGNNYKSAPIVLISSEANLKVFDKDLTSQNLFDFAISKDEFRNNMNKYSKRINSFINAYKTIIKENFKLEKVLGLEESELDRLIDYRLIEKSKFEIIDQDVYAFCRFVNKSLIRCVGPLVGKDILSARLGVSKESKDWDELLDLLKDYRYTGILSDIYERWWMEDILNWWNVMFNNSSLRRLNSEERVKRLCNFTELDLLPIKTIKHAKSTNFWTICIESKMALDPSEGYIIEKKIIEPWQDFDYLSLDSALEQSDYRKYLSPIDKNEIREIEKNGTF